MAPEEGTLSGRIRTCDRAATPSLPAADWRPEKGAELRLASGLRAGIRALCFYSYRSRRRFELLMLLVALHYLKICIDVSCVPVTS